jgi:hypothetical protein
MDNDYVTSDIWHSSDGIIWTSATLQAPWLPRYGHASVVYDGRIWLLGGWATTPPPPPYPPPYQNDVWYSSPPVPPSLRARSWELYR